MNVNVEGTQWSYPWVKAGKSKGLRQQLKTGSVSPAARYIVVTAAGLQGR